MIKRNTIVKLSELPERRNKLNLEDSKEVYGGCGAWGCSCKKDSECCPDLYCGTFSFLGSSCNMCLERNPKPPSVRPFFW